MSGAMSTGTQEASVLHYTSEPFSNSEGAQMPPASLGVSGRQDSASKSLITWEDRQKLVVHSQTLMELQAKMETMERNFKQKVSVPHMPAHMPTHMCMNMCTHTQICTLTCVHTYTFICASIHTYTHTHMIIIFS